MLCCAVVCSAQQHSQGNAHSHVYTLCILRSIEAHCKNMIWAIAQHVALAPVRCEVVCIPCIDSDGLPCIPGATWYDAHRAHKLHWACKAWVGTAFVSLCSNAACRSKHLQFSASFAARSQHNCSWHAVVCIPGLHMPLQSLSAGVEPLGQNCLQGSWCRCCVLHACACAPPMQHGQCKVTFPLQLFCMCASRQVWLRFLG